MPRPAQYDRDTALQKAVALFWEKGYHASSMKQIEQALDMRPGSLYATFGNKDGLFSEALATYAARGGQELAEHMAGYESIAEGLQDYLRNIAHSCTAGHNPSRACMIVKTLLESTGNKPELAGQAEAILQAVETSFTELLEQAKGTGELQQDTDCPALARLIQAQIMGLRAMAERGLDDTTLLRLGEDMARILELYRQRRH